MIQVIRAEGRTVRGPASQPTLEDLPGLLTGSGIVARSHVERHRPLPITVQCAVFRLTQEGLTGTRQRARGAEMNLRVVTTGTWVATELAAEPGRALLVVSDGPRSQVPKGSAGRDIAISLQALRRATREKAETISVGCSGSPSRIRRARKSVAVFAI